MFDANLVFRSSATALSTTETSSAITINETPVGGLCLVVFFAGAAANSTIQTTLQHSTDNSTYTNLVVLDTVTYTAASTVPKTLRQRFVTRAKYLKTVTTTGGTGTPSFTTCGIVIGDFDAPNNYTGAAATTAQAS